VSTAHARRTDPDTSHDAAESVGNVTARQVAVLRLFLRDYNAAGMTDMELIEAYEVAARLDPRLFPEQSHSGLRTRRSELVHNGFVVDTGQRRRLPSGRWSIVWAGRR